VNLRPYLEFGVQTAYEAGRLTLGYFGTEAARPQFKADDTPVTVADRDAERLSGTGSGLAFRRTPLLEKSTAPRMGPTPTTVGSSIP